MEKKKHFESLVFVLVPITFVLLMTTVLCGVSYASVQPGIYWTDENDGHIYHANLDGSNMTSVLYTGDRTEPRSILVDSQSESIYWAEWRTETIRRSNIDGTGISTVIDVGGYGSSGFDIDFESNRIYWTKKTGGFYDSVKRANLNGTNERTLMEFTSGPVDLALDTDTGWMYWTIATTGSDYIKRSGFDGSNVQTLCVTGRNPYDIELDLANGKMYWTEYNGYSPGFIYSANLDGTGKRRLISGVDDPFGLTLDLQASKMYWTDCGRGVIQRSNLDGSDVEDLITGLSAPRGIAVVSIPEPATLLLLGLGGLTILRKRK